MYNFIGTFNICKRSFSPEMSLATFLHSLDDVDLLRLQLLGLISPNKTPDNHLEYWYNALSDIES